MKKIFLFVAAASLALGSCSSDDNGSGSGSGGSVKFTVDGTQKNYNTVVVSKQTFDAGTADEYTQLAVTATTSGSATEFVTFYVDQLDAGSDAIYSFNYAAAGDIFYNNGALNTIVTTSTTHKLKGTFSGTVVSQSGSATKALTNGTFDISY